MSRTRIKSIIRICLIIIIFIIPLIVIDVLSDSQIYCNSAKNWSGNNKTSHISTYIAKSAEFSIDDINAIHYKIDKNLKENNGGNLVDCYSMKTTTSVSRQKTDTKVTTYAVGGDFFIFHNFKLLSGSYFTEDNVMDDLVVIDEDVAWNLFGSIDVQGMTFTLEGADVVVAGVIEREQTGLAKAAGNHKPAIYMSYSFFSRLKGDEPITSYEIMVPNLSKNYAMKLVKGNLEISKSKYECINVSERFETEALIKVLGDFGKRSMQTKEIVYPYWENAARYAEDICAMMLLLEIIMLICLVIYVVIKLVKLYIHINTREVDSIILDIGMVLAEFRPREYLKNIGIPEDKLEAVYDAVINNDIWNEYDRGVMSEHEALGKFIEHTPELEKEIKLAFRDFEGIIRKYDYTESWISSLQKNGYKVLYLSNISEKLYRQCKSHLNFVERMDGGILSFEDKMKKPEEEIYFHIIEKCGINPQRSIFIDDREENIATAKEMGFKTILFTSKAEADEEIKRLTRPNKKIYFRELPQKIKRAVFGRNKKEE